MEASLTSALLGAILTIIGTYGLQEKKLKTFERSTVLAIKEELKTIIKLYGDEIWGNIENGSLVQTEYKISQNLITVYENNADKLGLIKDTDIRNGIIETYALIKRFVEEVNNYYYMYAKIKEIGEQELVETTELLKKHFLELKENIINLISKIEQIYKEK